MQGAHFQSQKSFYLLETGIDHCLAFTTTRHDNLGFDQDQNFTKANRERILSSLGISLDRLTCAQQIHSDGIVVVDTRNRGRGAYKYEQAIKDADALITKENGAALAVLTADCLPVFIIDKNQAAAAVVHAGWRGTQKLILYKTLLYLREHFKSTPESLCVFFGPAIRRCCYEVGAEFLDIFKYGLNFRNGRFMLDLIALNAAQCRKAGILEDNIFDMKLCTVCRNDQFFSYRQEKEKAGRQMSVIMLKESATA